MADTEDTKSLSAEDISEEPEESASQIEARKKQEIINEINAVTLDSAIRNDSNTLDPLEAFSLTGDDRSSAVTTENWFDVDAYNDDEAEERFLRSKPTCFVILGKPGCGKTTLAQRLSAEWRCELINSTELLIQNMELATDLGKKCSIILGRGEALPEDLVLQLMESKIKSPEIKHYGYVLDDLPSLCEDSMSIKDQLDLIQNFSFVPDFIINIKMPDDDLTTRRVNQKIDPITGIIYTQEQYNPAKPEKVVKKEGEEEEEEEDDDVEEEEEDTTDDLDPAILERLRTRPEDMPRHVQRQIAKYKSNMLRLLEDYMTDHNQEHLIEVDGNQSVDNLFKQLMMRLSCFSIRPAAVPVRLSDAEEEDAYDDMEVEEMMRMLTAKETLSSRFKWRRSKWLRNCPVALSHGDITGGKVDYSVAFLDKVYCLSSAEYLELFIKNPRPYLLPPMPRTPCKLSVIGPELSGKTRLAHLLAAKYNAKVIDVDVMLAPHLARETGIFLDNITKDAKEKAILAATGKEKERVETLKQKKRAAAEEAALRAMTEVTVEETEGEEGEEKEGEEGETTEQKEQTDTVPPSAKQSVQSTSGEPSTPPEPEIDPDEIEQTITEDHPEVVAAVKAAVKQATDQALALPVDMQTDIIEAYIKLFEKTMHEARPNGPQHGGWVLDNYPRKADQCNTMVEHGLIPDEVVCLSDNPEGDFLQRRWYNKNKENIDEKMKKRKADELKAKKELEEAKKRQEEEEKRLRDQEAREAAEEDRKRRIDAGEDVSDVEDEEAKEEKKEESADKAVEPPQSPDKIPTEVSETVVEEVTEDKPEKLPTGPEMDAYLELRKESDKELNNILGTLAGSTTIDPIKVVIDDLTTDEILNEAVSKIDRPMNYLAWEYTSVDMDEEEDDVDDEEEDEDEEEEETAPEPIGKKKALGDTNHFCPVAFKETGVLYPGNPENAAKYCEKVYFLSTADAKDKFLEDPHLYVPTDKPFKAPPLRLLILGSRGAGKSLHARQIANKLGIFHIQFKERLQEMVIHKTKKKVGPEFEEDEDDEEEDGESDDEEKETSDSHTQDEKKDEPPPSESQAQNVEEEEEDANELTEDEQFIKSSIETDEALIPEILDTIVPQWWNKEPFRSKGFILEGYPRNIDEARYLGDLGLFPDAAVMLNVEDTDVIARLLPPKMDKWRTKRDKKIAKRQKKKDKALKKRQVAMEKRRAELVKERDEKKSQKKNKDSDDDESKDGEEEEDEEDLGEEEEDDIEMILAEEFEEEEGEEEEEDELEEDAEDRMRNELEEVYDNDTNRISSVAEVFEELMIPKLDIDAARRPHIAHYLINKQLRRYIDHRESLFERVYPISEALAKRMLQVGYKQPSVFGRWCPVKLMSGDCIQPMSGPGYPTFPCMYRQHIYFLSTRDNRNMFINNPIHYLRQPAPKPVVPVKIAVIGPPKSGKTWLAQRFATEYGVVRLSLGDAIRLILEKPHIHLAQQILKIIRSGQTIPDELAVQCVSVALMEMQCQTRGYILDGFPITKRQIELMTERHIIPVRVIELKVDSHEVMIRGTKDRLYSDKQYIHHDSSQILSIKLAAFQQGLTDIRQWYDTEHMNYSEINAQQSKWKVWDDVHDVVCANVRQIQTYLQRIARGKAASIADMCVTPSQFEARMGDFGHYCPVSLATCGHLVDNSLTRSMKYTAEFRGHYYKLYSPKELKQFLATPEIFVPPQAPNKLPPAELLPTKVTEYSPEYQPEILGYCPVSYLDGKLRYEALLPGSSEFMVKYQGKYYNMESEAKMEKYMRSPDKYCNLVLPHKLPCTKVPENITSLPLLGYLEQGVCTAIIKAMTAAGNFKPKYPFMTASKSALVYIGYHLKAYNPKNSDYIRKKYKQKLEKYEESCRLIKYLGNTMTVRYKDPPERPQGFDNKLETFFALKQVEPTATWIT